MKCFLARCVLLLAGMRLALRALGAEEVYTEKPAYCEPGFQLIEETGYREVERRVCKEVPIKRTKWVYSARPDYFCLPRWPCSGHDCSEECSNCKGLYCRKQLVKKRVEYECGTQCVVEVVKDRVPCAVWRKVPCEPAKPVALPTATPMPADSPSAPEVAAPR